MRMRSLPVTPPLRQQEGRRQGWYAAVVAVDDPDTIDIMSINPTGAVVLTIADHLDWADSTTHQSILQAKMNRYLAFIESGEILEHHADAADRGVVIEVLTRCEPDADGWAFLRRAQAVI